MARDHLHSWDSYQVIGGIMSPASDGYGKANLAPASHRVHMCRLAVGDSNWIVVDDWEARQPQFVTTLLVLDHIKEELDTLKIGLKGRHIRIMFLCGADLVHSFRAPGLWHPPEIDRIVGDYGIVIVDRWGSDISEDLLTDTILYRHRRNIQVVKQYISNDISSTKIRLYIRRGMSIKYLLPETVIAYINEHGLFKEEELEAEPALASTTGDSQ